jgi:plastocyanin
VTVQRLLVALATLTCFLPPQVLAANVQVKVVDHNGEPLEHAVISLTYSGSAARANNIGQRAIDQIDKEFVPHVLVVEKGASVFFPNKDDIRHHVYSFSKPKEFELPLYKGTPAKPVVFDKTGVVKLGCNIHDWMLGYIYVVDTPYFAVTDDTGGAVVTNLPAGNVIAHLWHPRMKAARDTNAKKITLTPTQTASLDYQIKVRKEFRVRRAPRAGGRKY